ncbi:MAG TPA: patatin-like phospholipase family protein [Candidatus Dormibacteraeota bacterium]|nr:patatin-like phospholipase family protein [Candidatus Dormibacteraeota bacterium]
MKRLAPPTAAPEGNGRTAFVLSGGGSLGAVQVGMLQALTEAGIRPDLLIGTSVGAVNAAWIGGKPDHEGALVLGEVWRGLRRQDIFPLRPWSGARGLLGRSNHMISNSSLGEVLRKHLPYHRLEDAAVPVHVMATELKSGRAVLMSTGPAVPALLASTAIPGIFPPVTIGRRDFIDGGVANHTPIAAAMELGASRIFVLPVGYPWLRQEPTNALGMALHALARFIEQKLDAEVAAYRHLADIQVLPTPDAPAVSPADFSHTDELIARGYRSCRKYLALISQTPAPAPARQLALAAAAATQAA